MRWSGRKALGAPIAFGALVALSAQAAAFGQKSSVDLTEFRASDGRRPQVVAQVDAVPSQHRDSAVYVVKWRLTWTGRQIVRGHLRYEVADQNQTLGRFKSSELALSEGERSFLTMLPGLGASNAWADLVMRAEFVTAQTTYVLGEFQIRLPRRTQRTLVVCAADPWGVGGGQNDVELERSFRFERFHPDSSELEIATVVTHVAVEDFPEEPHSYCVFDIVLLADEGLTRVRNRQLRALLEWVKAGGSLVVAPGSAVAKRHVDFLNAAVGPNAAQAPFLLSDSGAISGLPPAGERQIILARNELGRVAVILERPPRPPRYDAEDWRRMVWFLWKGKHAMLNSVVETGRWPRHQLWRNPSESARSGLTLADNPSMSPRMLESGVWLLDRLMPEKVRMMPLSVMGAILVAYVLVVGPVDYFLLGWLRLRRWTWIVFPLVTLGFASFTLLSADRYMSTSDQRRAAVFLDVDGDGRIIRENRIELLMMNTHSRVTSEVRNRLFTPIVASFGGNYAYQLDYSRFAGGGSGDGSDVKRRPADFSGTIPAQYEVVQSIPKWTPQLNRLFGIRPRGYEVAFDWNSIAIDDMADELRHDRLYARLRAAFAPAVPDPNVPPASVYIFNSGTVRHIGGPELHYPRYDLTPSYSAQMYGQQQTSRSPFLYHLCARPEVGMFRLISQLSPTAGDNFEDLSLLDPTDENQWLLLVGVRRGDDLLFYRKLYFGRS